MQSISQQPIKAQEVTRQASVTGEAERPRSNNTRLKTKKRVPLVSLRSYAKASGWWDSKASRADLSFVDMQPDGVHYRSYWNYPYHPNSCYHEGKALGRKWFQEVVELAKRNPPEALVIIELAQAQMRGSGWGVEIGFMEELGRYAVAAALAFPKGIPAELDAERHKGDWYMDWIDRHFGSNDEKVTA